MSLKRVATLAFFTALCACFSLAHAQMYKCQAPNGRMSFQDKPCAGDAKQGVIKAPDAGSASPGASPGDPEGVYRRFHQSILASFNPQLWISQLPAAKRQQFARDVQASLKWVNAVQFMKDEMPRTYRITGKTPGPGRMRLSATGQGKDFFGKPEEQDGVIDLVAEGGTWKIVDVSWGKRRLQ